MERGFIDGIAFFFGLLLIHVFENQVPEQTFRTYCYLFMIIVIVMIEWQLLKVRANGSREKSIQAGMLFDASLLTLAMVAVGWLFNWCDIVFSVFAY